MKELPDEGLIDQGVIESRNRDYLARLPDFVLTPTAKAILKRAMAAKEIGTIIPIEGSPGIGKTRALRHVAATQKNAFYIQCTKATGTVTATLKLVARSLGIGRIQARPYEIEEEIIRWLSNRRVLLLIDEAQYLGDAGFETVRGLFDRLEEDAGIGVVFSGHDDELLPRIFKLRQLSSRCATEVRLSVNPDDAEALFHHWGFICPKTSAFLRREFGKSSHAVSLRRIAHVFSMAIGYADASGEPLSFDHVKEAWADFQ